MKQPLIIGITGGIGGGKSTFCRFLAKSNQLVYNTDNEAKRIQEMDSQVVKAIKQEFGDDIYQNGALQRSKLGSIVFADAQKLQKLNDIVHPAVVKDFQKWVKNHSNRELLFMECAILFEAEFSHLVDRVVVVTADKKERIKRVIKRNHLTQKEAEQRLDNQFSEQYKLQKADWIFDTTNENLTQQTVDNFLLEVQKF